MTLKYICRFVVGHYEQMGAIDQPKRFDYLTSDGHVGIITSTPTKRIVTNTTTSLVEEWDFNIREANSKWQEDTYLTTVARTLRITTDKRNNRKTVTAPLFDAGMRVTHYFR